MKKSHSYRNDRAAAQFIDTFGKEMKDSFVNDLLNANYYSVLTDGSTDASITEQEVVYVLYLSGGEPKVKFLGIEAPDQATADGLKENIEKAFHNTLANLCVDGASVNTGIHNGLGAKMQVHAQWLTITYCFNHNLELAVKDYFDKTYFKEIDNMLLKLFYLYRKSPKRLRELKKFEEIYDESIPKPYKSYGTRWIAHKIKAMEIVLNNYGVYIQHLESLAQTDSQALKRAEIQGEVKKWKNAKFPIHLAMYIDVLTPLKVLSLGFQKEKHDPVLAVRRIKEFNWTMAKLQILVDSSLEDGNNDRLIHITKLFREVADDGNYPGVKISNFTVHQKSISESFEEIITKLAITMENRFSNMMASPVFENLVTILDVSLWPEEDKGLLDYGDESVNALVDHFRSLIEKKCNVSQISSEWDRLKLSLSPKLKAGEKDYLKVWKEVFSNKGLQDECKNVLHIIEILLITPFTNAKIERVFSRMNRLKTDSRNRLGQARLETQMRVGEEGVSIDEFEPDLYINKWFQEKVRRINGAKPRDYPSKRRSVKSKSGYSVIDIAQVTLSDLENSDDEFEQFD
ncbi:zinc finger protein 862-like [Clytia hemisphaerica]|uniref:zinc finger protein 862-like n=1 Tax=Clytia hemisphaerica TaxID=252671 RepID=UPI0034D6A3C9